MAINITINSTLVDDQSAGVQTPLTPDTGNDSDLVYSGGMFSGAGYSAPFLSFLNAPTIFGSTLTDAEKQFAANVDGAESSSSFVTVTATAGETISDLFFSDSSGSALTGQQVFNTVNNQQVAVTTLDGSNIYLWSNGDYAIAATKDAMGNPARVVAAFHLNEAANHLSAQVEMVTFEALSHPVAGSTAAAYDDALNFSDVLQVSAAGSLSFNFDNLPSGSFLYAAVGTSSAALLVTGQDLNVQQSGPKAGNIITGGSDPSDTVNTSQGGIGATIGINSQHFSDVSGSGGHQDGPVGVFTLVKGFGSFDATMNGTSEGTGGNVNEITYSDYVNVPSAKIFISQSTGSSSIGGGVRVTLWEAGGGALTDASGNPLPAPDHTPSSLKPEEGLSDTANSFSYIGNTTTDSHLRDDTPVTVGSVTVQRGNSTFTFTGSGGTQSGITVSISSNAFTVTGLQTSDTLGFTAADTSSPLDGTFNRFDVQALANSNPVDIGRIDLTQGVSISHGVGSDLIVQDDGPSLDASLTNAPSLTVDESNFAVNDTKSFANQFTPHYGTDGPAGTPVTYSLSTAGGDSGLIDTLSGQHVMLSLNGSGQIEGRTATSNLLVFVISVDSSGNVTLDGSRAVVHSPDTGPDQSTGITGTNLVVLNAVAHDGDGDTASNSLDITSLLNFKDDAPTLDVTATGEPSLTVDESNFAVNDTKSFAGQFTPHYGADGPAGTPVTYALSTPGGASGLVDTLTGENVVLSLNASGQVEGRTATTNLLVFVVSVDGSGNVTLDGSRAVVHSPDTGPDQSTGLTGSNLVVLTATAHDGDGDTASQPLDITSLLNFKDDAPTLDATATGEPSLTVDESNFAVNDMKSFAGQFTPHYGADGPGGTPVTYSLTTPGGASGLVDTLTGENVVLSLNASGQVEGRTATTNLLVFVVSVDGSGNVTLDGSRAVVHSPDTGPDQSTGLTGSNLVVLHATAHDGDGDTASQPLDITSLLNFKDDAPTLDVTSVGAPSLTVDESNYAVNDTKAFAGQFTPHYGADGPAGTPVTYGLSTPGGASGLIESGSGQQIWLFKNSVTGNIEGKAGATQALAQSGSEVVFVVSVDSSGNVTLDQNHAVVHNPDSGPDQSTGLVGSNLVVLNATAHDGDGDTASQPLDLTSLLIFKDDAPTITAQIQSGTVAFATGATGTITNSLNGAVHADINNGSNQSLSGIYQYTITPNSWTTPTNVYPNLNAVLSTDHTTLTYYSDAADTNAVYRLTLDQTGGAAGSYTFSVLQPPPVTTTHFDFTDLPSGQNLFGIIATNKADLSQGGLLVMPSNPDINDGDNGESNDGTMTNTSGTVNTSKGGGPVTIGNGNQAFDNAGEGAYFMYVDNPQATAVGGLQLTQVTADDADTIKFNGVNQATDASVSIVQASGMGTAKSPGPAVHISAWEASPGNVNTDALSRALVNNPTVGASEVNIIGVKIHATVNNADTVIESATRNADGTTHYTIGAGGPNEVHVVFQQDKTGIYSVDVQNLKANETIEFITATNHDLAKVTWSGGSFDIGGFNIMNQANVPQQDFHFAVQINDYDNDVYGGTLVNFANFDVHVSGITFA